MCNRPIEEGQVTVEIMPKNNPVDEAKIHVHQLCWWADDIIAHRITDPQYRSMLFDGANN
jgi:hypothetical protein